ncbi:AraC family transcriptional activator of pobA [Rhizobium petrolearium]|uniref:Helix-turn-helix domain-containing protein n=2 Tax=Neorhizobium TaxID=1525371 RepID=A0ABV0MDI4_9HYPH|nr:helix-turn-helix domain-containing protein [Neorhizobium petrolearium]MBP1848508.1 AraC family transcriptional activator of pobA [Neorhizobium petrolearium]MCC2614527.1 helix-turn-helix domain-containing protein [Neorhizobium petrolearium]WGI72286.1 helix-turn-helix domain-containing protein [Neorhizobium petrolearium]
MLGKITIPRYYLYGDPHSDVDLDFLHTEAIHERSGPNNWIIRPHAHPDHTQILLVLEGGGWIRMEEKTWQIAPLSLIVVPASIVHEINFLPGTDGEVITAASAYIASVARGDPALIETTRIAAVYPVGGADVRIDGLKDAFHWLHYEFIWSAPGRRLAIMAQCLRILVSLLRARSGAVLDAHRRDRNYDLFVRFRDLLEQYFREEKNLGFYSERLHVTVPRLNLACKARGAKTASNLLYERVMIEAKRYLLYTEMSVTEISHALGFDDLAYFSRFFSQRAGMPAGFYRRQSRTESGLNPGGVSTTVRETVPAGG